MPLSDISIEAVADMLELERDPRNKPGAPSFNCRCPFCSVSSSKKGYKLNINVSKGAYNCFKCGTYGGTIDLYSRVRFGVPAGKGSGKEFYQKLKTELGQGNVNFIEKAVVQAPEEYKEILPADNNTLNRVYSALLGLKCLKLTEGHRRHLRDRGLSDEMIDFYGYASMSEPEFIIGSYEIGAKIARSYYEYGFDQIKKKTSMLRNYSDRMIIAGMLIANDLKKRGIELNNIPGFFKLGNTWCLKCDTGILIPTRDSQGRVISIQTRRERTDGKKQLRYLTLSSKGLDFGVNERIARTHFSKYNDELNENSFVCITEGPLKSDIAAYLYHVLNPNRKMYIIAVQGTANQRDMTEIADMMAAKGVKFVYNAFDMDKVINPNVGKDSKKLMTTFRKKGIKMLPLLWDKPFAESEWKILSKMCMDKKLEWNRTSNIFADLYAMTAMLAADPDYEKREWNKETKGIDDYFGLMLRTEV